MVWLNSAQKQIFTDKIFVVERELWVCTSDMNLAWIVMA